MLFYYYCYFIIIVIFLLLLFFYYTNYEVHDKLPSLTDMGMRQLFPSHESGQFDRVYELKKLLKSLLLKYVDILNTLANAPEQYPPQIEDMRTLFINMHHLVNEWRPHQARETLCMLVRAQIEETKQSNMQVLEKCNEIEHILEKIDVDGLRC